MASSFSDLLEQAMLDWFINGSPTQPSAWYVSLFTTKPTNNESLTGGTECSGTGYARQSVTLTRSGSTLNPTATVTFGPATAADWGTVEWFGIHSAVTSGDYYCGGDLTTPRAIGNGDSAEFTTSNLAISLD